MMKMGNPHMAMGMDIVHVVVNVHVCINVYLEFLPYSNGPLSRKLFENLLLLFLHHLGHHIWVRDTLKVAAVEKATGFCHGAILEGKGLSTVRVSSS